MEDDGFVLVRSKRKTREGKRLQTHPGLSRSYVISHDVEMSQDEICCVKERIIRCRDELSLHHVLIRIKNLLRPISGVTEIICFGLGSVTGDESMYPSRYQLALLLLLRDMFGNIPTSLYDPKFNRFDRQILESYDLTVRPSNEDAAVRCRHKTLFFMPRCPFNLFTTLFRANADSLSNVTVFGNELTHLRDVRYAPQSLAEKASQMMSTTRLDVTDSPLENLLNDTALTYFSHLS